MSHSKERHEKNCLNCNTEVAGRYCQVCGQENTEPKESVWGIISHFAYDITHFDGKFFSTLRTLVIKPGFLSKEYMAGRRMRYLHPIRMYVFTSAVFFLVFFSVFNADDLNINRNIKKVREAGIGPNLDSIRIQALQQAATGKDSVEINRVFRQLGVVGIASSAAKDSSKLKDSTRVKGKRTNNGNMNWNITDLDSEFPTKEAYDSAQARLPESIRDSWFERKMAIRSIEIKKRYGDNREAFSKALISKFLHTMPYMLFVSLPLYALFLQLLYVRRRQYYYVNHVLFMIHLYIFTFIFILVYIGVDKMRQAVDVAGFAFGILEFLLVLVGIYYTYKAMRVFYGQGRLKTFTKFLLFNILTSVSLIALFVIFFLLTVFRV